MVSKADRLISLAFSLLIVIVLISAFWVQITGALVWLAGIIVSWFVNASINLATSLWYLFLSLLPFLIGLLIGYYLLKNTRLTSKQVAGVSVVALIILYFVSLGTIGLDLGLFSFGLLISSGIERNHEK